MAIVAAALATLLQFVPPSAVSVIIVPDVERAMADTQAYATSAGLPDEALAEFNLDETFLQEARDTVDLGPAITFFTLSAPNGVTLVKLTDPAGFRKAYDAGPDDDIFAVTDDGSYFATIVGDVAALAAAQAPLMDFEKPDQSLAPQLMRKLGDNVSTHDLVAWVDLKTLRPQLMPMLQMGRGMMQMALAQQPNAAQSAAIVNFMVDDALTLTASIDEVIVRADVDQDHAQLDIALAVDPDSPPGAYLQAVRPTNEPLVRYLPQMSSTFIIGYEWALAPGAQSWIERMSDFLLTEFERSAEASAAERANAKETLKKMMRLAQRGSNGAVSFGDGKLLVSGTYFASDPAEFLQVLEQYGKTDLPNTLMNQWTGGIEMTVAEQGWTEIAGTRALEQTYAFETALGDPTNTAAFEVLYGDAVTYYGFPAQGTACFVMGQKEAARPLAEKIIQGAAPLAKVPNVEAALERLTANPEMVTLVNVAEYAQFIGQMLTEMPQAPPVNIKPSPVKSERVPLVAVGLQLDGPRMTTTLDVPAGAIKTLVEMFETQDGPRELEPGDPATAAPEPTAAL